MKPRPRKDKRMGQVTLAENLRVLRARKNVNISDAAVGIGITRETLRDLEMGTRNPYFPTMEKIAEYYSVPVNSLFLPMPTHGIEEEEETEEESVSYGGERFKQFLVEAREKSRDELLERYAKLDSRLEEFSTSPATRHRKLGGQAAREELGRLFRGIPEAADELRAVSVVLDERRKKREAEAKRVGALVT